MSLWVLCWLRDIGIIQQELLLKDLNLLQGTASGMERNVLKGAGGKEVGTSLVTRGRAAGGGSIRGDGVSETWEDGCHCHPGGVSLAVDSRDVMVVRPGQGRVRLPGQGVAVPGDGEEGHPLRRVDARRD